MITLSDIIDIGQDFVPTSIKQTKKEDNAMKVINFIDAFEYLRFVDNNKYEQLQVATKEYKTINKDKYDEFINNEIIKSTKGKYTLDYYLKEQYILSNKCLNDIGYTKLVEDRIIPKIKGFFRKENIHKKINLNVKVDNKILGLLFDRGLAYLYDDTINYLEFVKSIKSELDLLKLFEIKEFNSSDDILKELFGNQLSEAKVCLDKKFKDIKVNKMIYSHDRKMYGYPDLIADNCIVDIKISKNDVINVKNYLQVLSYGLCTGVQNVYIYDIENGDLYFGKIDDEYLNKMIDGVTESRDEVMCEKFDKKLSRTNYRKKQVRYDDCDSFEEWCKGK